MSDILNIYFYSVHTSATMIFSWGMDGTTGQARYNQADAGGEVIDDHSLFTVT